MKQYKIISGTLQELPTDVINAVEVLNNMVWPRLPGVDKPEMPEKTDCPELRIVVIESCGHIVASAESFARTVCSASGPLPTLALASVCTHPQFRRQGFASIAVREILKAVDNGAYPVAFWQTGVPDFYRTLGAATVENRFYNSLHPTDPDKNPFWEPYAMIYPAQFPNWPAGDIDIQGLGF